MADDSHLDQKYFINSSAYNCPFCNRNHVEYKITDSYSFNWSKERECYVYFVQCSSCKNRSMHLSYDDITHLPHECAIHSLFFDEDDDKEQSLLLTQP